MGFDAGYELRRAERLDDIVVGAETQSADFVDVFPLGRYHEDRNLFFGPDALADVEAVHPGQHDVQQNEIVCAVEGPVQAFYAVGLDVTFDGIGFEEILFQFGDFLIIFNDEYFFHILTP
jgi:hypothetical protein